MSTAGGSLEKAEIEILNGKHTGEIIECRFNPPEYVTQNRVTYGDVQGTGSGASIQQFVNKGAETLTMELFFDTSAEQTDVREEYLDSLDLLVSVDPELHAPPVCQFVWGNGIAFTALVERLDTRFTMFQRSGVPVRAKVDITFKEYKTAEFNRLEVSAESTDVTKAWTVTEGDTLWLIAAEEYGDASQWRVIAEANDLHNPRSLEPGQDLELPPL